MKKLTKYLAGILFGTLMFGMTAFAEEVVVTPVNAVGYTNENTEVKAEATVTGALVLTKEQCPDNIGIIITGVTNTGFWEVDLGQPQKFYIEGAGLVNINGSGTGAAVENTTTTENTATQTANAEEDAMVNMLVAKYNEEYGWDAVATAQDVEEIRYLYRVYKQTLDKAMADPAYNVYYYSDVITYTNGNNKSIVSAYFRDTYFPKGFTVGQRLDGRVEAYRAGGLKDWNY